MRNIFRSRVAAVSIGALVVVGVGAGSATAAKMIDSDDVRNNSLQQVDLGRGSVGKSELKDNAVGPRFISDGLLNRIQQNAAQQGEQGPKGEPGDTGPKGPKGDSGLEGAFYAQAYYNQGDTNAGAIATVACSAEADDTDYVAIAGGVQTVGLDDTANSRNTPVSSSFPGRMDWSTNTPREGRLDGWIVQFGGNAGAVSDKNPEKAVIWALCLPEATIPVEQTFSQVG
jgi:hypothetical protein